MLPALTPGVEIVATDSRQPGIGDLVVFEHPGRDDFWMVKRRSHPPEPIPEGHIWALSDNPEGTDSRTMGPIPNSGAFTVVTKLDLVLFAEAARLLTDEDPALRRLVLSHGLPDLWLRKPGFPTLMLFILEQQVSLESASAVHRRLIELAGRIAPERIVELGLEGIMSAGVTRQKAGYIFELARQVGSGSIDLDRLHSVSEDTARATLLSIRGIGPWTADVYLLSALRHLDTFPIGDRALQVGAGETLGMGRPPDPGELELLAEPWRPLRSVAARLIWHGYLTARGRTEPVAANPVI